MDDSNNDKSTNIYELVHLDTNLHVVDIAIKTKKFTLVIRSDKDQYSEYPK